MNLFIKTQPERATPKRLLFNIGFTAIMAVMVLIGCVQLPPGYSTAGHASWPAPQLGVVVDENMKVVDIDRYSTAEEAGIQVGDILINIDGVPFTEKDKAKALIWESPGEEAYEAVARGEEWQGIARRIELERDGEVLEVTIMPAPLTWWGLSPTPTAISPDLQLDYL
jgi:membrane-associated protease RseP (regulator of RpoE activity)